MIRWEFEKKRGLPRQTRQEESKQQGIFSAAWVLRLFHKAAFPWPSHFNDFMALEGMNILFLFVFSNILAIKATNVILTIYAGMKKRQGNHFLNVAQKPIKLLKTARMA